ncbi:MAG: Cys-Gln thioester bond-forming surface protein [Coriobacteriia bacterium]|nr:Cys-Gln thioester bond-forming surface protein [Coriobacteriia bacterium]
MKRSYPSVLVALMLLFSSVPFAFASAKNAYANTDDTYSATVRYYDDVQLTYTLTYPSGGLWSGNADLPIGAMGSLTGQIYCVDPFVPFHSHADTSYWDAATAATVDIKDGYTVSAPWLVSPALRQNYDAVCWLTLNGYRGDYLKRSTDAESAASVEHLKSLYLNNPSYPGIVVIDETIALMATKLAIWEVLTDNSVLLLRTSIDRAPARRSSLDALVNALMADALSQRATSRQMTAFRLGLEFSSSGYSHIRTEGLYEVFGSFVVTAGLQNTGSPLALDKVFLTVNGNEAEDIVFLVENNGVFSPLPKDAGESVYGTANVAQYLQAGDFATDGEKLVSRDIYLSIPAGRDPGNGDIGDLLNIRAYAMARAVELLAGTPVTFMYGANGLMDWNAVQAFIGAAKDGMSIDLYSDATLDTGDTPLGGLYVLKSIDNATPLDFDTEFTFQLLHANSPAGPWSLVSLSASGSGKAHQVHNAASLGLVANTFSLKHGGMVLVEGLAADTDDFYIVREVDLPPGFNPLPRYTIPLASSPVATATDGAETTAFQFADGLAMVSFVNDKEVAKGHLYIGKSALTIHSDGSPIEYDIENRFEFLLEYSNDSGTTWFPVNLTGIFGSDGGSVVNADDGIFTLSSKDLAFVELDTEAGLIYRVTELNLGDGYVSSYAWVLFYDAGVDDWMSTYHSSDQDSNWGENHLYATSSIVVEADQYCLLVFNNVNVNLVNLQISKTVSGTSDATDLNRLFSFMIICETENLALPTGIPLPLSNGSDPDSFAVAGIEPDRIATGSLGYPSIIQLKHGETATVIGLPAGTYVVLEVSESSYETAYAVNAGASILSETGRTEEIEILVDTLVSFTNTKQVPNGPDNPKTPKVPEAPYSPPVTPRTGDIGPWLVIGAMVLTVMGGGGVYLSVRKGRVPKRP